MPPRGFKSNQQSLPGARFVQNLLQRLLPGDFVKQVLVLQSRLKQG
jgi:hypothetical protein